MRSKRVGAWRCVRGVLIAGSVLATNLDASTPESSRSIASQADTPSTRSAGVEDTGQVQDGSTVELTVYLMTMSQGSVIWEHFGHNALVIEDPEYGTTIAWNWGLFDFRQSDFIPRFLRGEMMYWMDGFDANRLLDVYRRQDRTVWLDELALTQRQARALQAFVLQNSQPENRFYRYDYFVDNCSTRVRDALDHVLDGALSAQFLDLSAGFGYRHETERLTQRAIADYVGVTLMLGPRGDVERTQWEQMFTPLYLRERLKEARVRRDDGTEVPLIANEQVATQGSRPLALAEPPRLIPQFVLLGLVLGAVFLLLGWLAAQGGWRRWPFVLAGAGWSLVAGLGGLILLLVHWTDHVWMYGNENILQLSPVSLLLVVAIPLAVFGGGSGKRVRAVAWGVGGLALLGYLAQVLPGVDQHNGIVIATTLPTHLGVAGGLAMVGKRRDTP